MRPEGNQVIRPIRQHGKSRANAILVKDHVDAGWTAHDLGGSCTGLVPPVAPEQKAFRVREVLSALRLPPGTRLQFGGREWLQDFDDDARLIARLP